MTQKKRGRTQAPSQVNDWPRHAWPWKTTIAVGVAVSLVIISTLAMLHGTISITTGNISLSSTSQR